MNTITILESFENELQDVKLNRFYIEDKVETLQNLYNKYIQKVNESDLEFYLKNDVRQFIMNQICGVENMKWLTKSIA